MGAGGATVAGELAPGSCGRPVQRRTERRGRRFNRSRSDAVEGWALRLQLCRRGRGCRRGRAAGDRVDAEALTVQGADATDGGLLAGCRIGCLRPFASGPSIHCQPNRRLQRRTPRRLSSFMASCVRSLIASRSHWATDIRTFSKRRRPSRCRWRRSPATANRERPSPEVGVGYTRIAWHFAGQTVELDDGGGIGPPAMSIARTLDARRSADLARWRRRWRRSIGSISWLTRCARMRVCCALQADLLALAGRC